MRVIAGAALAAVVLGLGTPAVAQQTGTGLPGTVTPGTVEGGTKTAVVPSSGAPAPSSAPLSSPAAPPPAARAAQQACGAATVQVPPSATIGGTLRLTGSGWCNPTGGGSAIAVKIDDGAVSHLAGQGVHANLTIWQIVNAAADGSLDATITLPTNANSAPAFAAGAHRLRLLTGTLAPGDTPRSVESGEFTVTGGDTPAPPGPGKPAGVPDPLDTTEDLTEAARGGVTATLTVGSLKVTTPAAAAGDWVFLYVHDPSPRPVTWLAADAAKSVTTSVAGLALPVGAHKVAVLDRTGKLLGWDDVTVAAGSTGSTGRELAATGAPTRLVLGTAVLLLAFGGVFYVAATTRPRREGGS
ncbi:hypothetical protein ACFWNN_03620 [Lentzea sp. NPDC058450]|uniref:hypothetical protein n=1 Tax=Lentzea sp. NPDC058450 TaxID=3346505 RepID=UPI0036655B70